MQLQFLINRKSVKNEPREAFDACEDFFLLVTKCHILCAIMKQLERNGLDSEQILVSCDDDGTSSCNDDNTSSSDDDNISLCHENTPHVLVYMKTIGAFQH